MNYTRDFIGRLVEHGYTVSLLDGDVFLYDSQGRAWASIEPYGLVLTVNPHDDEPEEFVATDWNDLLSMVERAANGERAIPA